MVQYGNLGGNSGVSAYEIGSDYITVKLNGTVRTYTYSYRKAGKTHVDKMKALAVRGYGLNSYINTYAKFLYD